MIRASRSLDVLADLDVVVMGGAASLSGKQIGSRDMRLSRHISTESAEVPPFPKLYKSVSFCI